MERILTLAMLFSLNGIAQPQITWLKYLNTSTNSNTCESILQLQDSGFILSCRWPPQNGYVARIYKTNKYGDTLHSALINTWCNIIQTYDKNFVYVGGNLLQGPGSLTKIDSNLNQIWTQSYPQFLSLRLTLSNDSGFILNSSSTVIKTDSLGVIQWTQSFIGIIRKVIPCKNGDILVVGYGAGYNATYRAMLLSATGQLLWQRQHGVVEEDWGTIKEFGINDAVELPDGNFLAASGSYHPHFGDSAGWDMIKLDRATGDTLQTYVFDTITGSPQYLIHMTNAKDSNILICADGRLIKIKQDGSLIWYKHADFEPWDLISCSDNGLAIAGVKYTWLPGSGNFKKKSTYAKLDSLGNIYNYQGIPYIQPQLVSVYPNPASNQLTIDNLQLTNKPFTLTVYDVLDKMHLTQNTHTTTIDISTLTPGLYVLRLQQGDKMYYGRFVKE
ncbi:MAG: T9SS type A sorting domain-containing protein [Bacteroidia bacterium]|nr:T9SS type A sorting domain-containing protein [Bacteroidia bacterium]